MSKITEQLREAISESGLTRKRIARETGIGDSGRISLLRWLNRRQATITSDMLDKLCEYLGLELRPKNTGDK